MQTSGMKSVGVVLAGVLCVLAAGTASASAADPPGFTSDSSGNVTCTVLKPAHVAALLNVSNDLILPPNTSCGLLQGSVIGHDVIIESGAEFDEGGATIARDVIGFGPSVVEFGDLNDGVTEGHVGRDVVIAGLQNGRFGNFICQTSIARDLVIAGSAADSQPWGIGQIDGTRCRNVAVPGNTIGKDASFVDNQTGLDIANNQFATNGGAQFGCGRDLQLTGNSSVVLDNNSIGRDCRQSNNAVFAGIGNTAGRRIDACNSVLSSP
jgi:hypothetical protein